ncbi:CHRD domain-containing protein [Fodinibius salsisoli]|uniref:CHRD domain-containing protein n=1 Tax=Fodinibius salsisoli TaxID=2820877 RepID=A0ABT3PMB4_9BACT|nr:CHRD domain-containing protein [Fodinibius salsisoli]MCW9707089.1 CHRD domain-containing protein [Fodinibius salsisoli]
MNTQISMKKVVLPVLVTVLSFGLLTGCGNSDTDKSNGEDMSMTGDQTMTQQRMSEGDTEAAMNEPQTFEATLQGSNEVPEVNTDATGDAMVTLNGDSIHVQGQFSGLSSVYTASHIHEGAKGENGGPILTLKPELGNDKMSGMFDGSYQLDDTQIKALKEGSLYINVHSENHKPGEIRGQLTATDDGM